MVWTGSGRILEHHDVVIEDGRIAAVRPSSKQHESGERDCSDRWILPGLIDAHMHFFGARSSDPVYWSLDSPVDAALRAAADARRVLAAGFTTVRDAGSRIGVALQNAIAEGEAGGPRVFPAHFGISRTGGHGDVHSLPLDLVRDHPFMAFVVDGPAECQKAVRMIARAGGRWVKIWATGGVLSERDDPRHSHLTPEELAMIVGEAHTLGLTVGAHCEGLDATKDCVKAGVDVIEHGFHLDEEVCEAMARRQIPLVTTLAFLHRTAENRGGEVPQYAIQKANEILRNAVDSVRLAHEKGVPIAMGTDTFAEPLTPYGLNAEELRYLQQAGLSTEAALRAATAVAARTVGAANMLGTLDPGTVADLIVLDTRSPFDDLNAVIGREQIRLIVKSGRLVGGTEVREEGTE